MSLGGLLAAQAAAGVVSNLMRGFSGLSAASDAKKTAEDEAAQAHQAASIEVGRIRERAAQVHGSQMAQTAKSGLSVSQGSPALAMLDTLRKSEEDVMVARWKGEVAATEAQQRAAIQKSAGRQTFLAGLMGAGGAALTYSGKTDILKRQGIDLESPVWGA